MYFFIFLCYNKKKNQNNEVSMKHTVTIICHDRDEGKFIEIIGMGESLNQAMYNAIVALVPVLGPDVDIEGVTIDGNLN
jgi:formyltetrahydrofolate synthetase